MSTTETDTQREAREAAEKSAAQRGSNGRDKGMPDGARPGDSDKLPDSTYAYDADAKASAREGAPVTIGGVQFVRVKKSWDVTRELRKLIRESERNGERMLRLEALKDAKTEKIRGIRDYESGGWESYPLDDEAAQATEGEIAELDDEFDRLHEETDAAGYKMIRLLLRATGSAPDLEKLAADDSVDAEEYTLQKALSESWPKPADEFLKAKLDSAEASELVRLLTSGREPDPTPATPSS